MRTCYLLLLYLCYYVEAYDVKLQSQLVLALAGEFNAACLRVLHCATESFQQRREKYALMKSLMNDMNEENSQRFLTATALDFKQLTLLRMKFRGQEETCYKPLEIIIASMGTKKDFTTLSIEHSLVISKWIIFLSGAYNESSFLEEAYIPFDAQVIAASPRHSGFALYEVFRVNRTSPLQRVYLGYWYVGMDLRLRDLESIYMRRSNLQGMVFRTGSIENWPVSFFAKRENGERVLDGFFPRVWGELANLINFSSINLRSDDNSTGDLGVKGDWSGLVGMLLRDDINVIVSELNMNEERTLVMDFTHPLLRTSYNVYFRISGYDVSWRAVLNPFDPIIWVSIVIWIIFGAVVLAIFYICCRPYQLPCDLSLRPYYSFFFMMQTMCQQGYSEVPSSVACRIVFLMAYLLSAVIIPSYSASLVSSLTAQIPNKPFDSLEEMLHFGRYKLLVPERTAEYAHFAKSKDDLYAAVYENLMKPLPIRVNNSVEGVSKLCGNDLATFGVETTMDIRTFSLRGTGCDVTKMSQPLSKVSQCIGLVKGSPYTGVIDYFLAKMFAAGVVDRIRRSVWPLRAAKHDSEYKQVSLSAVLQVFMCLVFGIILSNIILCLEIIIAKAKRPKNKRNKRAKLMYSCKMLYDYPQYYY